MSALYFPSSSSLAEPTPSTAIVTAHQAASIQRSWEMTLTCSEKMAMVTQKLAQQMMLLEQETTDLGALEKRVQETSGQLISRAKQAEMIHEQKKSEVIERMGDFTDETADHLKKCINASEKQLQTLDAVADREKTQIAKQAKEIDQLKSAIAQLH